MASALTNSGENVIERKLQTNVRLPVSPEKICEEYELHKCSKWILDGKYSKVALQFPDELLIDAVKVSLALEELLGFRVYILGDTTYGSCCVDEVAAEHVGADAVIHFGQSCLSPTKCLPVLYVFTPRIAVDASAVVEALDDAVKDRQSHLIFAFDCRCFHAADEIGQRLVEIYPNMLVSQLVIPEVSNGKSSRTCSEHNVNKNMCNFSDSNNEFKCRNVTFLGRTFTLHEDFALSDYSFVYLGADGPTLTCLSMKFSENVFYHVQPDSDGIRIRILTSHHAVMSRSSKIEQVRDASLIGILVGTLGVENYVDVILRLKTLIKGAGKRPYVFVMGKPNEAKLANMPEIDVFVYVACPETSLVERTIDAALYKKLVTPWELEVALNPAQKWSLSFSTDFQQLLPGGELYKELPHPASDDDSDDIALGVSLLTNKIQHLGPSKNMDDDLNSQSGALTVKTEGTVASLHLGGAGHLLGNRCWSGLDPQAPAAVPFGTVVEGRKGIAAAYVNETSLNG